MNRQDLARLAESIIASINRRGGFDNLRPRVGRDDIVVDARLDCDRAGDVETTLDGHLVGLPRKEREGVVAEMKRLLIL